MTKGIDTRLNSVKRRALRMRVLKEYGDGATCPCLLNKCDKTLTYETLTMDRIVPGAFMGRYRIENVRPACETHNKQYGGVLGNLRSRFPLTLGQWQDLERKGVIDQLLTQRAFRIKGPIQPVETW